MSAIVRTGSLGLLASVVAAGCWRAHTLDDAGSRPDGRPAAPDTAGPAEPDAWAPPTADVDLLMVVDNSISMSEEQTNLVEELPRLISVLATGDRNGDGTRDVVAVTSLHFGVVTTDMGAGPTIGIPTCAPGLGDDGILRTQSRFAGAPCVPSYPSGVFAFEASSDDAGEFAATIGCVAAAGTGGCGFEQPLEASLKALAPSRPTAWTSPGYAPPAFSSADGVPDESPGHGDGANDGFVRRGSILAIVVLSDEEDCSVRDTGLFVPDEPRFVSVPLNLRCHTFGDPAMGLVRPVERYVEGLAALRTEPRDLVFSAVVGIPPALEPPAGSRPDFARILASPSMTPRVNAMGTNLEPSCESVDGIAYPPIRIVQTAAGLSARGAHVGLASICSRDLGPLLDPIWVRLAERFPSP